MTNIVENLELKIKNVHIRYEDPITIPDNKFACGITIGSLTARSCDANWTPGFTTAWIKDTASFKLVELTAMSFYWDPLRDDENFGDISSNELAQRISESAMPTHEYVVSPVSAQAHLKRDRSETPLRTRSRPRLVCDLILEEVQLTLNDVSVLNCRISFQFFNQYQCFFLSGSIVRWLLAFEDWMILRNIVDSRCYDLCIQCIRERKHGGCMLLDVMDSNGLVRDPNTNWIRKTNRTLKSTQKL